MQIARLDSDIAMQEFIRQSESHLLEITRTYWALYAARVTYLQKARLVNDTARVTDELRARQKMDAGQSQLFRAESALASRRSDLVRSEAAVRNAQDRLRALTSDPTLLAASDFGARSRATGSCSPARPSTRRPPPTPRSQTRPEINQAFLQLRAATIREKMQRNELLPELNLVLQGSLGGLDDGDYGSAYSRQYDDRHTRLRRRLRLQLPAGETTSPAPASNAADSSCASRSTQLRTTIDTVLLEVKISAREVATAYRETQAKYAAVKAFTEDIETLQARRSLQADRRGNADGQLSRAPCSTARIAAPMPRRNSSAPRPTTRSRS